MGVGQTTQCFKDLVVGTIEKPVMIDKTMKTSDKEQRQKMVEEQLEFTEDNCP